MRWNELRRSAKQLAFVMILIPGASTECSDCAGFVAEQLAQTPKGGALIGSAAGTRLARVVVLYQSTLDRCPRSRDELVSAFREEDRAEVEEVLEGFLEISLYESPPGHCAIEYVTRSQDLSEALGDADEELPVNPRLRPQRGVIQLDEPSEEEGRLKVTFTVTMFEAVRGAGGHLEERALFSATGTFKENESGAIDANLDFTPKESEERGVPVSPPPSPPSTTAAAPAPPRAPPTALPDSERRTALVVGNGGYASAPLRNPVNDATDVAATLRSLGFDVTLLRNASQREMEEAASAMAGKLARGGVGLFYYSGHGIEIDGQNYLIPVGASIEREADAKYRAVSANWILEMMEDAENRLNILILDACRDNPFTRSWRSASAGLAAMTGARGVLLAYATGPGDTAAEGEGRNSPYTRQLLRHMDTPGVPIESLFKRVGAALQRETRRKQVPWVSLSLIGDFYFVRDAARG